MSAHGTERLLRLLPASVRYAYRWKEGMGIEDSNEQRQKRCLLQEAAPSKVRMSIPLVCLQLAVMGGARRATPPRGPGPWTGDSSTGSDRPDHRLQVNSSISEDQGLRGLAA